MSVFSFRAISCTLRGDGFPSYACFIYPVACILMHDLSISCVCFHFVQQVARYKATYPPHAHIFISCNKLHATMGWILLMRVFSFRATRCTLQGDLSIPCAYFHFVQQVARYEATYPSHARISISCNKLHATRRPIHPMSVFSFVQHVT